MNEVCQLQFIAVITPGDRHDESKIGSHHVILGFFAVALDLLQIASLPESKFRGIYFEALLGRKPFLDRPTQTFFIVGIEKVNLTNFVELHSHGVRTTVVIHHTSCHE